MHKVYMDEHKQERGDGGLTRIFLGYHNLSCFAIVTWYWITCQFLLNHVYFEW
jgi:hypothetical protein